MAKDIPYEIGDMKLHSLENDSFGKLRKSGGIIQIFF